MYRAILYKILLSLYVIIICWMFYKSSLLGGVRSVFVLLPGSYLYLLLTVLGLLSFAIFKIRPQYTRLSFFELIIFVTAFFAIFLTSPFFSQDVYWNLSNASNFLLGINPYTVSISDGFNSSFSQRVYEWRDVKMTYGPVSLYIHSFPLIFTSNLLSVILILRIIWLGVLALCSILLRKIMTISSETFAHEKIQIQLMTFFSPLALIYGLADLHNDVFVMLALLSFYYFLLKKHYGYSMLSIVLGVLTKYILVIFLPLLAFDWYLENKASLLPALKKILPWIILSIFIVILVYLPFLRSIGSVSSLFTGLFHQVYFSIVKSTFL